MNSFLHVTIYSYLSNGRDFEVFQVHNTDRMKMSNDINLLKLTKYFILFKSFRTWFLSSNWDHGRGVGERKLVFVRTEMTNVLLHDYHSPPRIFVSVIAVYHLSSKSNSHQCFR